MTDYTKPHKFERDGLYNKDIDVPTKPSNLCKKEAKPMQLKKDVELIEAHNGHGMRRIFRGDYNEVCGSRYMNQEDLFDYMAQELSNQRQELRQELVTRLKKYKSKIKTSGSIYSPGQSKEEVYFSTKEQTINDAINLLKEIWRLNAEN